MIFIIKIIGQKYPVEMVITPLEATALQRQ